MLSFDNFFVANPKHLVTLNTIYLVNLVAFVVHCEALSLGLRCTKTGSHILAMWIPVPLIRQGYNMASAMPGPNVNLQLQGSWRRPEPAEIGRYRSLQNTKGKYNIRGTSDTKNVLLHDHINRFPDQFLIIRGRKIFCDACKEILSSKKSVIKLHCASQKHVRSKEKSKSKLKEQTIAKALSREKSRQDSTLLLAQQAYRQEIVEEFLKAGIPISKIDKLHSLLEKNGHRLTSSSNIMQYITVLTSTRTYDKRRVSDI